MLPATDALLLDSATVEGARGVKGEKLRFDEPSALARLLIADDHALLRGALRGMLDGEPGLRVVGEAADGREAVALCKRLRPDLVLMDVSMPRMDGLEATRRIKEDHPLTAVVMVTAHDDPDYLYEALKAGAAGYVLKHSPPEELVAAVRRVLSGDPLLAPELAVRLLMRLVEEGKEGPSEERPEPSIEPLTTREVEVAALLAKGKTNRQIAHCLTIGFATAKRHVEHIIAKLGVSDRTQAAVRAVELGLFAREENGS